MKTRLFMLPILASLALAPLASASSTPFDGTTNGWGVFGENDGTLGDFLLLAGGNPGGNLNFVMVDTFGVNFHNSTDASLLGNYGRFSGGVTFSVDIKVNHIIYDPFFTGSGNEVSRPLVMELIDNNPEGSDYPYTSVWYKFGDISLATNGDWTHLSVTIADPTATVLPAGWGGYGDEDPNTFEPILPADRTFASVLAGVDEVRFTTFEPGWFFGFTFFDLQYDNASVVGVPEPTSALLLAPVAMLLGRRRR